MALRRRCDVNDVRRHGFQHLGQIRKALCDAKAFTKLSHHKRFQIAESNDVAAGDSTNRVYVLIRDLTAADYCDPKHPVKVRFRHLPQTAQRMRPLPESSVHAVSTQAAP